MRTVHMGIGALAGMAVTLLVINSLYPDIPRRMMRDGRRLCRQTRRTVCDIGEMMGK